MAAINLFEQFKTRVIAEFEKKGITLGEQEGVYNRVHEYPLNEEGETVKIIKNCVLDDSYEKYGLSVALESGVPGSHDYNELLTKSAAMAVDAVIKQTSLIYDLTFEHMVTDNSNAFNVSYWFKP